MERVGGIPNQRNVTNESNNGTPDRIRTGHLLPHYNFFVLVCLRQVDSFKEAELRPALVQMPNKTMAG